MTSDRGRSIRLRVGLVVAAALLIAGTLGASGTASAASTYSTAAPMILSGVLKTDLDANTYGICNGSFQILIRNVTTTGAATDLLNSASRCHLKVILHFSTTISGGTVYPSRVAALVNAVKGHPALYGYLSVKEPAGVGISAYEIRSLYKAYRAADPGHPVIALFGDVPHFGMSSNPYTGGMANIVMLDWYPVETGNGGRALTGSSYVSTGPTHFHRIRYYINSVTLGIPVWLMVQTHKYLAPTYHKKQRPGVTMLYRQVREGFTYLSAKGIAFHVWSNTNYNIDERRDPAMVSTMITLSNAVHAGTFQ